MLSGRRKVKYTGPARRPFPPHFFVDKKRRNIYGKRAVYGGIAMKITCILAIGIALGIATMAAPGVARAESLAGQIGDKRYPVQFPVGTTGPCERVYKQYIAASGHSAYAQTSLMRGGAFFCGAAFNARSKEAAEERALADCKSVGKKYKVKTAGRCLVYVSK